MKRFNVEPEETIDEWGIKRFVSYEDGERIEGYEPPRWDHVYSEDGDAILCPNCSSELFFHDGECRCIECMSVFSASEIDDLEGSWYHS